MGTATEAPAVLRFGGLDMQVCVPAEWSDDEIVAFAQSENRKTVDGIVSDEKANEVGAMNLAIRREGDKMLGGYPERNPCSERPGYVHVVLDF